MMQLCLEWWMFEAIIIMTGLLPDAETNLAVIGALFNLGGLAYMIPLGLQGHPSIHSLSLHPFDPFLLPQKP